MIFGIYGWQSSKVLTTILVNSYKTTNGFQATMLFWILCLKDLTTLSRRLSKCLSLWPLA